MSSQPVKIAVAGTGFGRKVALPVYRELEQFEPVAVWSRDSERARQVAGEHGVPFATSDFDELLEVPGLEAVHVATPVVTHVPLVLAAAEHGLHVVCEKPLATDLEGALRIARAVRSAGIVAVVDYELRLRETRQRLIGRAREVVGRPRLVTVSLVQSDHSHPGSRPFTWVHDATLGGGRLQGYGVHDLDLLLQLFPEVEAVATATHVSVPVRGAGDGEMRPVTAEDTYALLLRFRGGGLGVVSLVAAAWHDRADVIELYGDEGTVRLDGEHRVWSGGAGEDLRCEGPFDESLHHAFSHVASNFWSAVREGTPPDPSLDEALRVQAVFDAARKAESERRWVRPEEVPPLG